MELGLDSIHSTVKHEEAPNFFHVKPPDLMKTVGYRTLRTTKINEISYDLCALLAEQQREKEKAAQREQLAKLPPGDSDNPETDETEQAPKIPPQLGIQGLLPEVNIFYRAHGERLYYWEYDLLGDKSNPTPSVKSFGHSEITHVELVPKTLEAEAYVHGTHDGARVKAEYYLIVAGGRRIQAVAVAQSNAGELLFSKAKDRQPVMASDTITATLAVPEYGRFFYGTASGNLEELTLKRTPEEPVSLKRKFANLDTNSVFSFLNFKRIRGASGSSQTGAVVNSQSPIVHLCRVADCLLALDMGGNVVVFGLERLERRGYILRSFFEKHRDSKLPLSAKPLKLFELQGTGGHQAFGLLYTNGFRICVSFNVLNGNIQYELLGLIPYYRSNPDVDVSESTIDHAILHPNFDTFFVSHLRNTEEVLADLGSRSSSGSGATFFSQMVSSFWGGSKGEADKVKEKYTKIVKETYLQLGIPDYSSYVSTSALDHDNISKYLLVKERKLRDPPTLNEMWDPRYMPDQPQPTRFKVGDEVETREALQIYAVAEVPRQHLGGRIFQKDHHHAPPSFMSTQPLYQKQVYVMTTNRGLFMLERIHDANECVRKGILHLNESPQVLSSVVTRLGEPNVCALLGSIFCQSVITSGFERPYHPKAIDSINAQKLPGLLCQQVREVLFCDNMCHPVTEPYFVNRKLSHRVKGFFLLVNRFLKGFSGARLFSLHKSDGSNAQGLFFANEEDHSTLDDLRTGVHEVQAYIRELVSKQTEPVKGAPEPGSDLTLIQLAWAPADLEFLRVTLEALRILGREYQKEINPDRDFTEALPSSTFMSVEALLVYTHEMTKLLVNLRDHFAKMSIMLHKMEPLVENHPCSKLRQWRFIYSSPDCGSLPKFLTFLESLTFGDLYRSPTKRLTLKLFLSRFVSHHMNFRESHRIAMDVPSILTPTTFKLQTLLHTLVQHHKKVFIQLETPKQRNQFRWTHNDMNRKSMEKIMSASNDILCQSYDAGFVDGVYVDEILDKMVDCAFYESSLDVLIHFAKNRRDQKPDVGENHCLELITELLLTLHEKSELGNIDDIFSMSHTAPVVGNDPMHEACLREIRLHAQGNVVMAGTLTAPSELVGPEAVVLMVRLICRGILAAADYPNLLKIFCQMILTSKGEWFPLKIEDFNELGVDLTNAIRPEALAVTGTALQEFKGGPFQWGQMLLEEVMRSDKYNLGKRVRLLNKFVEQVTSDMLGSIFSEKGEALRANFIYAYKCVRTAQICIDEGYRYGCPTTGVLSHKPPPQPTVLLASYAQPNHLLATELAIYLLFTKTGDPEICTRMIKMICEKAGSGRLGLRVLFRCAEMFHLTSTWYQQTQVLPILMVSPLCRFHVKLFPNKEGLQRLSEIYPHVFMDDHPYFKMEDLCETLLKENASVGGLISRNIPIVSSRHMVSIASEVVKILLELDFTSYNTICALRHGLDPHTTKKVLSPVVQRWYKELIDLRVENFNAEYSDVVSQVLTRNRKALYSPDIQNIWCAPEMYES
jgi:hypothetical protein